jgi:hypothetical protein
LSVCSLWGDCDYGFVNEGVDGDFWLSCAVREAPVGIVVKILHLAYRASVLLRQKAINADQ